MQSQPIANLLKTAAKLAEGRMDPQRVVVADTGKATSHRQAMSDHYGRIRWDVCYIREDGWTLAAPANLIDVARRQWDGSWVIVVDRRQTPVAIDPMLNGPCLHCGACCRWLIVEVHPTDVMREPALMRLADPGTPIAVPQIAASGEDYTDPRWDGRCLVTGCNHMCVFRRDGRCSIYVTRPTACVCMPVGGDKCLEARHRDRLPIPSPEPVAEFINP